jgi:hypothetical protein
MVSLLGGRLVGRPVELAGVCLPAQYQGGLSSTHMCNVRYGRNNMYEVQLLSISEIPNTSSCTRRAHLYRLHSHEGILLWNEPSLRSRTLRAEHVPFEDLDSVGIAILVFLFC